MLKCGFKIGGGIDQDYKKSPQGYTDYVNCLNNYQTIYYYKIIQVSIVLVNFYFLSMLSLGHLCNRSARG